MASKNTFHVNTAGVRWLTGPHDSVEYRILFMFIEALGYNSMNIRSFDSFLKKAESCGISVDEVTAALTSLCEAGVMFRIPVYGVYFLNPSYFWKGGIAEHYAAERLYYDIVHNPGKGKWSGEYKDAYMSFELASNKS